MRILLLLLLTTLLPAQAPRVELYGSGCGNVEMTLSPPYIGQPLYAVGGFVHGVVIFGFYPASVPMGGGCTLLVTPAMLVPTSVTLGEARIYLFDIPNQPGFVGIPLYAQLRTDFGEWSCGVKGTVGR